MTEAMANNRPSSRLANNPHHEGSTQKAPSNYLQINLPLDNMEAPLRHRNNNFTLLSCQLGPNTASEVFVAGVRNMLKWPFYSSLFENLNSILDGLYKAI